MLEKEIKKLAEEIVYGNSKNDGINETETFGKEIY